MRRLKTLFLVALAVSGLSVSGLRPATASLPGRQSDDAQIIARTTSFSEPLLALHTTTAAEDADLVSAIAVYEKRIKSDDVSSIEQFLEQHPDSGWAVALHTNLGFSFLHQGYFSKAITSWQAAWLKGRHATEPATKALVDGAVGNLAQLYASLGKFDELSALFEEIGARPISGSATESVQLASENLRLLEKDPRHLFICGPTALGALMLQLGAGPEDLGFVLSYRTGREGTNLAQVAELAERQRLSVRAIYRPPGAPVPVPSVFHWKVGHFATIIGERNGRYQISDPVFRGQDIWVTPEAFDSEASGYFLVPAAVATGTGWRSVETAEASSIWGKGATNGSRPGDAGDRGANGPGPGPVGGGTGGGAGGGAGPGPQYPPKPPCPMCSYDIMESSVSITLSDTPVGYDPPIGPSAKVRISYNQREASQPQNFNFSNVSPKWTHNWLSYVTDDPTNPGGSVSRYLSGGGAFYYSGYVPATGRFAPQDDDGSVLVQTSQTPIQYRRLLQDGGVEIYSQSNGSTSFPRRVFLTEKLDPQGNAVTLTYDANQRLTALTDAVGRQTTFSYATLSPLLVRSITDPFGRTARLDYDSSGRLISITDIIGLTSSFSYDANSLVNVLTTPYGATTFNYTAPGTSSPPRFAEATDPLGFTEREEWVEPAPIAASDAVVPQGMPIALTNNYLQYRNSAYWDKEAYVLAGCTPSGGCDYADARITHFLHMPPNTTIKATTIESIKYPQESRIWYVYPGQTSSVYGGTYSQPIAAARVLDDGSTQLAQSTYDPVSFKLTKAVDPLGRATTFTYANHIDLAAISYTAQNGVETNIAQYTYNSQHRPLAYTDAANRTMLYAYNAAGQLTLLTNPLGETTRYNYDASSNLISIVDANNTTIATLTYDAFNRVQTYTDSEGWVASYEYDAADRVTKVTYPDGTADRYIYDRLDLVTYIDRQAGETSYVYDANRRLTSTTDASGEQTVFAYNRRGQITSMTDPRSSTTSWVYDVQGRVSSKSYADTSSITYTYETTTSRLKSVTDPLGQIKQFTYAKDNRPTGIAYLNEINPTPDVAFAYDPYLPRLVSMTDGTGISQYAYNPVGFLGGLQLKEESGALTNSSIAYTYDALGRLNSRSVEGAGVESFEYDSIGRLIGVVNDLGTFTLDYLGATSQLTERALANTPLSTNWSYLPNSGDRRLAGIDNTGLSGGHQTGFDFGTTAENLITFIVQTSDTAIPYPGAVTQTATFNDLNQLTDLSGQALTYDANGNLLSDGQRNYTWDAEDRLLQISYPALPGKLTSFSYDGIGRRVSISRTPAGGGSPVVTNYIWCGTRICQSKDALGNPVRSYFDEGEYVHHPSSTLYYGVDQIGSVRRAFASTSDAPAYDFDPYGSPLEATPRLTDFGYAGMLFEEDSGLYLTQYRAYNPETGRWLSRDPLGEMRNGFGSDVATISLAASGAGAVLSDSAVFSAANAFDHNPSSSVFFPRDGLSLLSTATEARAQTVVIQEGLNLYGYVAQNPLVLIDPNGLQIRCDGFPAGCSQGGSYGTSAMYCFENGTRNLCQSCAEKFTGMQGQPAKEIIRTLRPWLIQK